MKKVTKNKQICQASNKKAALIRVSIPGRKSRQIALFSQKPLVIVQRLDQAQLDYACDYLFKGHLTKLSLGNPSLDHIVTDDTTIERVCLHLILSDFYPSKEVQNLNV